MPSFAVAVFIVCVGSTPSQDFPVTFGGVIWVRVGGFACRGRVVSYGDLAALVGIGPRQVGTIMATYGSNVTWWRVTNASGDLPVQLMDEVRERWAAEGILLKPHGRGCRIAGYRADLTVLAAGYQRAVADLA